MKNQKTIVTNDDYFFVHKKMIIYIEKNINIYNGN